MRDGAGAKIQGGSSSGVGGYVYELIVRDEIEAEKQDTLRSVLIKGEESGLSARQVPEIVAALKARRQSGR